jgi:hypothetical protein
MDRLGYVQGPRSLDRGLEWSARACKAPPKGAIAAGVRGFRRSRATRSVVQLKAGSNCDAVGHLSNAETRSVKTDRVPPPVA